VNEVQFSSSSLAAHIQTGRDGEDVAIRYLLISGYKVWERNVRLGHDEIDIVAFDPEDSVLVFVEVKTRSKESADFRPDLDLTIQKKEKMFRAARTWVTLHNFSGGYRLDVLFVIAGKVQSHIKQLSFEGEEDHHPL
jgi:putative endonuclease